MRRIVFNVVRVIRTALVLLLPISAPALAGPFCFEVDVPIPDNGKVVSQVDIVSGDCPVIADLNVFLDISHTRVGDLKVSLGYGLDETPDHTEVLLDRPGPPPMYCQGSDVFAWIDDEAPIAAESACFGFPAIEGAVIGGDPPDPTLLQAFDGDSPCGYWTLTVEDLAVGDSGTLNEWCVTATLGPGPNVPAAGHAAIAALAVVLLLLSGLFVRRRA